MQLIPQAKEVLERLHFTEANGLVLCNQTENMPIVECLHIDKARKIGASAVLFRRFFDKENEHYKSTPSVYIFEREAMPDEQPLSALHAKIWSAGEVEAYMIIDKIRVEIINARRPAEIDEKKLSIKNLKLCSEALASFNDQRFSAHIFGKGLFWEQEDFIESKKKSVFYVNRLTQENTPFYQLLAYLLETRKHLHGKIKDLSETTIDKLLIVCLLIKFLEEIQDDDKKHTLRDIYAKIKVQKLQDTFSKENGNQDFWHVIECLSEEFNGQVFSILNDHKDTIIKADLSLLVLFLNADLDIRTKQFFLWQQYNFNHLPVELVSGIYENFLPKQKGVVYTPPLLVNFLVDEVMPLSKPQLKNDTFRILDPSCGSGVFLVAAYKRLLQWWSINEYSRTRNLKKIFPDKTVCQKILQNNIFGVDIDPTATLITTFSLTIALLDKLSPKEIWNGLKFNNLGENIQTQDFFEWAAANKTIQSKFDLVLGNPPFNSIDNKSAVEIDSLLVEQIGFKHKSVPGNRLALQFFEGAMSLGKKTCLIIPSNNLLYRQDGKADKYRKQIFTDFTVSTIFDFTHLRRFLFNVDIATCALIARSTPSKQQDIMHVIVQTLYSNNSKQAFQIDFYDCHSVRWDWATDKNKQFVWKTNLLGGGRLFYLIDRLHAIDTKISSFFKVFFGFRKGNILNENLRIVEVDENNQPFIEIKSVEANKYLPEDAMYGEEVVLLRRTTNLSPYIVKKSKDNIYFSRHFLGIIPNEPSDSLLFKLYQYFKDNKSILELFITATSASALILSETAINVADIANLPFPKNESDLQLVETENIILSDMLNYYIHLGKAINKGEGRILNNKVSPDQLEAYGHVFCNVINSIYEEKDATGNTIQKWQIGRVYQSAAYSIYEFIYGKVKDIKFDVSRIESSDDIDDDLHGLVFNAIDNKSAVYMRVVREYDHVNGYDILLLIKPNALRYWLRSIALRDADDTIWDMYETGF
ncbi:MAG: N-6 DNA methylase [Bernardetiaceae bacterium]|nr:N-6 DNA methylase [Bernardetiaceae bacterium]